MPIKIEKSNNSCNGCLNKEDIKKIKVANGINNHWWCTNLCSNCIAELIGKLLMHHKEGES